MGDERKSGRYAVLGAVCLLAFITYVQRLGFINVAPTIKDQFSFDQRDMGWLLAAFQLGYALFEIPCGWLGDRLGVRHLLALLALAMSIITAAAGLVLGLPVAAAFGFLFIARLAFGASQAGIFPSLSRAMADWMPVKERGTAMGFVWMASRMGGAAAPFLMGAWAAWFGGWQWALVVAAIFGAIWGVAFWAWFRNPPRAAGAAVHHAIPWRRFLHHRGVWGLCLMYGFGGFAANFFTTFLPTYLDKERHLPELERKWLSGAPLACGIVACLVGGMISDAIIRTTGNRTWGRRLNGSVGLIVAGVALWATNYADSVLLLGGLLCLTFICNDLAMGPAWASCTDIGERYAGTLGGLMNMIGALAGALGNIVAGRMFDHGQSRLLFVIFGCSFGLAALSWLLIDANRPIADSQTDQA
jgi:ACS family glucarate transporter-like MFS transporter